MAANHILFVHGMYMNATSWQPWIDRAKEQGFSAEALSWPFHAGEPAQLRAQIDPALGRLQFRQVVDHYKRHIDSLPERPLLVGHSIGGLVVQKLVNDGYAAAAVSITPAPPLGIITLNPTFFKANFPHINPFAGNKPVVMTKPRFHYTFCNVQSRTSSDADFESYVVPESRNIPRTTLTTQGRINFKSAHVPLLLIAADSDHLISPILVRKNFRAYKKSTGRTELQEFTNRSHFICNQSGWEEVADASFAWLKSA